MLAATPIEETLRAYESLIQAGKVKAIGSSNATATEEMRSLTDASA